MTQSNLKACTMTPVLINKKSIVYQITGLFFSVGCVAYLFFHTDWHHLSTNLTAIKFETVFWIMTLYSLSFIPRTLRLKFQADSLADVTLLYSLKTVALGYIANNFLPFRLGEILRTLYFASRTNIAIPAAFSITLIERLLDVLVILLLFLIGLAFAIPKFEDLLEAVDNSGLVRILFIVTALSILFFIGAICTFRKTKYWKTARLLAQQFLKPFIVFRKLKTATLLAGLTLAIWLIELMVIYVAARAFDLSDPKIFSLLLLGALAIGMVLPGTPGNIGIFEAAFVSTGMLIGAPIETTLAMAIVVHFLQIVVIMLLGLMGFSQSLFSFGLKGLVTKALREFFAGRR